MAWANFSGIFVLHCAFDTMPVCCMYVVHMWNALQAINLNLKGLMLLTLCRPVVCT